MFSNLSRWEKRVFGVALAMCLLFLFLLTDDSFFDWDRANKNLQTIGTFTQSSNDVRHKISKQYLWKKAKVKNEVHSGDSVFTGKGSESRVRLNDGSEIVVRENSLVVFDMSNSDMQMKFNFGSLFGFTGNSKMKFQDCGQTYEISGKAGQFEIQKDGDCKGAKLKVFGGQVSVNGKTFSKNEKAVLKKGSAANQVVETKRVPAQVAPLKAPKFTSPEQNHAHVIQKDRFGKPISARNFRVKWATEPRTGEQKKNSFEFELATDPNFERVIGRFETKSLEINTPILPAGAYYTRVREKTKKIIWSSVLQFKVAELDFNPLLAAPKLLTPRMNYKAVGEKTPDFKWTEVKNASTYTFELSRDNTFKTSQALELPQTNYNWKNFAGGVYYYRVAAGAKDGTRGPASETGEIRINLDRPVLEAVTPISLRGKSPDDPGDPQKVQLKWTGIPIADRYAVEVSKDGKFEKPQTYISRSPASEIVIAEPGEYKWRVRPLDKEGRAVTSYSAPGEINYKLSVPLSTPKLMEPAKDLTMYFQKSGPRVFWMEWGKVRQAETYELEIAKDENFKEVVLTQRQKTSRFLVQKTMPQGKLYWRVRAEGEGRHSEWSEARRMRVFAGKSAQVFERED